MQAEPLMIGLTSFGLARDRRRGQPTPAATHPAIDAPTRTATPAAIDEVFAKLSRGLDQAQRADEGAPPKDDSSPALHPGTDQPAKSPSPTLGTIPALPTVAEPPLRPQPSHPTSLHNLAAELERQHERLTQLLREIDAATASD